MNAGKYCKALMEALLVKTETFSMVMLLIRLMNTQSEYKSQEMDTVSSVKTPNPQSFLTTGQKKTMISAPLLT
jgi:hypothetical protein